MSKSCASLVTMTAVVMAVGIPVLLAIYLAVRQARGTSARRCNDAAGIQLYKAAASYYRANDTSRAIVSRECCCA